MSRIGETGPTPEQMKSKAQETGQNIREMGQMAREAAKARFDQAREAASDYYQRAKDKAMEWEEGMEDYVREKPVRSLLIAAGVGLLLGILLRRR